MSDVQVGLTVGYAIVVVVACAALAVVFRSTRAQEAGTVDHARLSVMENRWGMLVVALLVAGLALTLWWVPYGKTDAGTDAQRVVVRAQQFGWSVQPGTVRAGEPVEFRLTSRDVQHGFGVYDGTELLFQVQVPARGQSEQRYVYTFDRRGTFEILCMEFCGFQHHAMRGAIKVN